MRFSDIEAEISNVLDVDDADLTPEQRELFPAYLDELAGQEAVKIDGFAQFCRLELERASAIEAEGKRLVRLAKNRREHINKLKDYYLRVMQAHGLKKVAGQVYNISIRATPVVCIEHESAIPAEFWREKVERTVDKLAIRDALKAGQDVAGARMSESFSLQVR